MGYSTRPSLIHENADLLTRIKNAVDSGEPLLLSVPSGISISSEQYRLRRVLAATDHFPAEFGGAFSRLGSRTRLSIDNEKRAIIASRRGGLSLTEYRVTEADALETLSSTQGSIGLLEFYPTENFDLSRFKKRTEALGWLVVDSTLETEADGKISLAIERIEKRPKTLQELFESDG